MLRIELGFVFEILDAASLNGFADLGLGELDGLGLDGLADAGIENDLRSWKANGPHPVRVASDFCNSGRLDIPARRRPLAACSHYPRLSGRTAGDAVHEVCLVYGVEDNRRRCGVKPS